MRWIFVSGEERRRRGEIWSGETNLLETENEVSAFSSTSSSTSYSHTTIETVEKREKREGRTDLDPIRLPQSSRNFRSLSSTSINLPKPLSRRLPSVIYRLRSVSSKSRKSTSNSIVSLKQSESFLLPHRNKSLTFLFHLPSCSSPRTL